MRASLLAFVAPSPHAVQFAIKTLLGGGLALWCALRFGLEMIGDAETEAARRKYMDGMDSDIQDLDKLVDEMLTYARLEQGAPALKFQQVDLAALVDQVITELAPLRASVRIERGALSSKWRSTW